MIKKLVISGILLLLGVGAFRLVSTGFYNLDYLGQGKLLSVTITDHACVSSFCEGKSPWLMTVNDPTQLKDLESAFFNKIQDIFHLTQEDGPIDFVFHYENSDIEFHASLHCNLTSGRIYYSDRQITYLFNKSEMAVFKELFLIDCPTN